MPYKKFLFVIFLAAIGNPGFAASLSSQKLGADIGEITSKTAERAVLRNSVGSREAELGKLPISTRPLPPFPYFDWPRGFNPAMGHRYAKEFDGAYVILGKQMHAVEGRIEIRRFSHRNANLSQLAAQRRYEALIKGLGATKVNAIAPEDLTSNASTVHRLELWEKLRIPERGMSYDTYVVRTAHKRSWIVLMVDDSTTQVMAIDEGPMSQTIHLLPSGSKSSSGAHKIDNLPPFPYIDWPTGLNTDNAKGKISDFDRAYIILGKKVHAIEGRIETRRYRHNQTHLSPLACQRNFAALIATLGGTKVNLVSPYDPVLAGKGASTYDVSEKLQVPGPRATYDAYLIRTPQTTAWIVVMVDDEEAMVLSIEEKPLERSVGYVSAEAMRAELATNGHVPLYINFDSDRSAIRPDGEPVIKEILALLKIEPALVLTIEGHTDNSGDAKRNVALSQQRAEAVVQALLKSGVDKVRLKAIGYGANKPLDDNTKEAGRAKNRRVELVKMKAK